jgi:hypothetical protein
MSADADEVMKFVEKDDRSLMLRDGDRPVFVYNHGVMKKEGVNERYNRACYIHPLYGLDGEVLTEDFAKDHLHHRGVFWAWPHVKIDGKALQTWVPTEPLRVRHVRFVKRTIVSGGAVLAVENGWFLGEEKVVREMVDILVHKAGPAGRDIDFDITWTAIGKPVVLTGAKGKSYGGFTIRFNTRIKDPDRIAEKDVRITVPEGITKKDLSVTRLPWADFTAPFPGAPGRSGATLFIHPSHPDHPPTWLTRHYGCLCVGWPGVDGGTLEPDKTVRCRYRVRVHRGDPDVESLKQTYADYAKDVK